MNSLVHTADPSIVTINSLPSAEKVLVCFHFAGGSAQSFYKWKNQCEDNYELIAFEFPGRGRRMRETFAESITALAEQLAASCSQLPDKPWIFIGHSLGALIAYETVRCLQRTHKKLPERLIISARNSPTWLPVSSGLPQLGQHSLKEYLGSLDGTPKEVLNNKPLMDMTLPILKSDLELIYNYEHAPSSQLPIPIDVFGGLDDNHVTFEALLAWKKVTYQDYHLHMISGGHFSLMDAPQPLFQWLHKLTEQGT
ncbi:thioesterase II family protein [Neptuniibacter sp. QD37_6]|uniref:thioesterase II family protein n=1 Tax=Neptuniibacter sp. QD37_6 TaxID=3398210 RepID=UPI0039F5AE2F